MSPTNPIDLCFLPARELAARIRRRDISPVEVVETICVGSKNAIRR